jgi:predicted kinase
MLRRAEVALGRGEVVVLDASWGSEQRRTEAREVATRTSSDLVELVCRAPAETAARRMRHRRRRGGDPSDATPEIAAELARVEDPWPVAAVVDTGSGPAEALLKAVAVVAGDEPAPS